MNNAEQIFLTFQILVVDENRCKTHESVKTLLFRTISRLFTDLQYINYKFVCTCLHSLQIFVKRLLSIQY